MDEFWYYKGLHKVKLETKSEGYWIVEAVEDFTDTVDNEKVLVKSGERRIVQRSDLRKTKTRKNKS